MKSSDCKNEQEKRNERNAHTTEAWEESSTSFYGEDWSPMYHQMSLSVSRVDNGEQTDIRIRRESGKPTEIYVSQGSEAWDMNPEELFRLPKGLREEVQWLLNPSEKEKHHWWSDFFLLPHHSKQERKELEESSCHREKGSRCAK